VGEDREPITSRVVVLVESTGGMHGGGYAEMIRQALVDPLVGLARGEDAMIGVSIYSGDPDADADPTDPLAAAGTCLSRTDVPSALDSAAAVDDAFAGAEVGKT